jgi:hypothetical protein
MTTSGQVHAPGKQLGYPLNRRLCESHGRSGRSVEVKNLSKQIPNKWKPLENKSLISENNSKQIINKWKPLENKSLISENLSKTNH